MVVVHCAWCVVYSYSYSKWCTQLHVLQTVQVCRWCGRSHDPGTKIYQSKRKILLHKGVCCLAIRGAICLRLASRSSSSARISLQSEMHSLQMNTFGPEMNFLTLSLDFPQKLQRRCFSVMSYSRSPGYSAESESAGLPSICWTGPSSTRSIRPYSTAASGLMKRSRSTSSAILSTG